MTSGNKSNHPSDQSDHAEQPAYYDPQDDEAASSGRDIRWPEGPVTRAVIELLHPKLNSFSDSPRRGCGANLDYDPFLAGHGNDVVGVCGAKLDLLERAGVLARASKSIALLAHPR